MFRLARFTRRGKRRKLPHGIASLSAPSLRCGWNNIHRMSIEDRREVVEGTWRQATTVRLMPDTSDRDAGGFVDGVRFRSDEEAEAFLADEMRDDSSEHVIPALQLARGFFEELAQTADSEVDVEKALETTITSDLAREAEERDVHHRFFSDFYIQQGLIRQEESSQFVNTMLQLPTSMVMVNFGMPFVRLMLRCQLEQHLQTMQTQRSSVVFMPHAIHPLLYILDVVPTLQFSNLPGLTYSQGNSVILQRKAEETLALCTGDDKTLSTSPLLDTEREMTCLEMDLMEALLNDDGGICESQLVCSEKEEQKKTKTVLCEAPITEVTEANSLVIQPQVSRMPLSIGHMYWLQRQVAADTLIDMDVLGVMLSSIIGMYCTGDNDRIVLDMTGRSRGVECYSYGHDIASHLGTLGYNDVEEGKGTSETVIISFLLPDPGEGKVGRRLAGRHGAKATSEDVPTDEAAMGNERGHVTDYHVGIESRIMVHGPPRRIWDVLRGKCDVVLCCPSTTADGRRPRAVFGTGSGEEKEEDKAIANRFISICSRVNKLFPYLRRELAQALEYMCSQGGRVVYATHSMNPLENEAVVCSVLTDFKRKYPNRAYRPVSLLEHQSDYETELLRTFMAGGRRGLETWVSLQDGPREQERLYSDEEVVLSVAHHSWRASPLSTSTDMCFICIIELQEGPVSLPLLPPPEPPSASMNSATLPSAFQWLDGERLRGRWGLVIRWDNNKKISVVISKAALRMIDAIRPSQQVNDYRIIDYGVCVGSTSTTYQQLPNGIVNSSLSGTLLAFALSDSIRMEYRSSRVVEFSVAVLLEFLHTRRISSQRLSELLGGSSMCLDALTSVEGMQTVFIKATPPKPHNSAAAEMMELHEIVMDELRMLVVVAQAHIRYCSRKQTKNFVLTLECSTERERRQLEERVVAIADALHYLLRRLGYPATKRVSTGEYHDPRPQLQDDEYELETRAVSQSPPAECADSLLGQRAELQHKRRMRRLGRTLRSLGDFGGEGPVNDWERDLRHNRRVRQRAFSLSTVRRA